MAVRENIIKNQQSSQLIPFEVIHNIDSLRSKGISAQSKLDIGVNVFEVLEQLPLTSKLINPEDLQYSLPPESQGVVYVEGEFGFPNFTHFQDLVKLKKTYPNHTLVLGLTPNVEGGLSLKNRALLLSAVSEVDAICDNSTLADLLQTLELTTIQINEGEGMVDLDQLSPKFLDLNDQLGVNKFKDENPKIIVITGTYNVFHPNHLSYIFTVRQMYPDAKIVMGLDNETWADTRKPGRKRQPLILRAATIAALFPDIVFACYDNSSVTDLKLLNILSPHTFLISKSTTQEPPSAKGGVVSLAGELGVLVGIMPAAGITNDEVPISSTFLEQSINSSFLPNVISFEES